MQIFDLPSTFLDEHLVKIIFRDTGSDGVQRMMISGITAEVAGAGGGNSPPVISGPTTGVVAEGGVLVATGQLTATDPDAGAAFTWSIDGSAAGAFGGLALTAAGKWTYTLDPALAAPLTSTDHPVETFMVKVQDGQGGSDSESVKVTVNGGGSAPPAQIDYPGFSSSGLVMNGSAAIVSSSDGSVLRLTPSLPGKSATVLATPLVDLSSFSTHFTFRMSAPSAGGGADGLTFLVAQTGSALGGGMGGGELGYARIGNSVAVEFDSYQNGEYGDTTANHIGIDVNGSLFSVATATVSTSFKTGALWNAWVDYDGHALEVRYSLTDVRPTAAQLARTMDIVSIVGNQYGHAGFTAGTGSESTNQDITTWSMNWGGGGPPANHPPVISGPATGTVAEEGAATATGQLLATDPDAGAVFTWGLQGSGAGAYGAFGVDSTGKWTYTLDPALAAPLTDADHPTETFTVKVQDGQGGSDLQAVTVTVNGAGAPSLDQLFVATPGPDAFDGGGGVDTVTYAGAGAAVRVELERTDDQNTVGSGRDTLTGIENLVGSAFDDVLKGDAGANRLEGGAGGDTVKGGLGDDVILGGAGDDILAGNGGVDTVSYEGAAAGVTVALGLKTAQDTGGAGIDLVTGFENLTGSSHNDSLTGDKTANALNGGDGDDALAGGAGADTLTGGGGADHFIFSQLTDSTVKAGGQDVIFDFSHTDGDRIDLSGLDADTGDGVDSAFHLIAGDFTHHAGELIQTAQAEGYLVRGDINGDGATDFAIFVQASAPLVAGDFFL